MSHTRHRSPLALPRSHGPDIYCIDIGNGKIKNIDAAVFHAQHHIDNSIRILNSEYAFIDTRLPFFTHFNMEFSGHIVGARMILPRILKQGHYRAPGDEELPILSIKNIIVGTVISKREHVPYRSLHDEVFEYSMRHIKNIDQLKRAILKRYSVSMPDLSDDEILKRGVGITTLRLEGLFEENKEYKKTPDLL